MQKCGRCAELNERQVSEELLEHPPAVGLEEKHRTTTSSHPFLRKKEQVKKPNPLVTHKNLFHTNKSIRADRSQKEKNNTEALLTPLGSSLTTTPKSTFATITFWSFIYFVFEMLFFQMQKWQNTIAYERFYSKRLSMRNTLHSESPAVVEIWGMLPRTHIVMVPLKSTKVLQFCFQVLLVNHPLPHPHPSPAHQ